MAFISGTTTIRARIESEMRDMGDSGPIVACTLDDAGLDRPVYEGNDTYTAWTATRVYFPVCCSFGHEWCGSAPREPCAQETGLQGGGS